MGDAIRVTGQINAAGLEMSIETGKLANLAAGAVVVTGRRHRGAEHRRHVEARARASTSSP